jgi:hypothetical protein
LALPLVGCKKEEAPAPKTDTPATTETPAADATEEAK